MRGYQLYLSTTCIMFVATVNGHIDFDRYEIYTRASNRAVINSFKVIDKATSWSSAKRKCEAENAHLVIPDSLEELNVLGLLFKKLASNSPRNFHVGLTDQVKEGVWVSVLGESRSLWAGPWSAKVSGSGDPNTAKNCAAFREGGSMFNDEDCEDFSSPYVCEKEIVQPDPHLA